MIFLKNGVLVDMSDEDDYKDVYTTDRKGIKYTVKKERNDYIFRDKSNNGLTGYHRTLGDLIVSAQRYGRTVYINDKQVPFRVK